jgi:methylglutaconyl-CoA hydratase/polyketide biosynthesis enoyl-CoA hydratase PksH
MRVRCDLREGPVWRVRLEPNASGEVALDGDGIAALDELITQATESSRCRVIVLESSSGVFCRGMDLRFVTKHAGEDLSERIVSYARCMVRLRTSECAVVSLVDGEAIGGGVGLAAAADVVIATVRASFHLPEVVLGLVPAMVLPLLQERMAPQKARWMALSGTRLGAQQAGQLGLVDEVVENAIQLEHALRSVLKRLLRASPRSVHKIKRYADHIAGMSFKEAMEAGAERTSQDLLELETIAAIRDFLAGESPPWFERYKPGGRS